MRRAFRVRACGRSWELTRAADLEQLWHAMTDDPRNFEDERLPYWTELWPSSVALAEWLALRREEIAGRPCLDLGCGLGLTALAGQWLGARVTAVDYEEAALGFADKMLASIKCRSRSGRSWTGGVRQSGPGAWPGSGAATSCMKRAL